MKDYHKSSCKEELKIKNKLYQEISIHTLTTDATQDKQIQGVGKYKIYKEYMD